MPNAKLRQMYSAMLRLRLLHQHSVARKARSGRKGGSALFGLEACLISPVIDLAPNDLVCDTLDSDVLDSGPAATPNAKRKRLQSDLPPTRLIGPTSGPERLWTALGAAAALRANGLRTGTREGSVLVCYARPEDASPSIWAKVLTQIFAHRLPLLLVTLPASKSTGSRTGRMSALAVRNHVPGIPVDQHDAVALFRASQEAIGHARLGGGGALIECVRYVVEGKKLPASDPLEILAQYMLVRNVADHNWLRAEAKSLAKSSRA